MTNLEYINKQILFVKQNIQYHKKLLAESEEEYADTIKSAIKFIEPDLQTLLQIKAELEIVELIKNGWSSSETTLKGDFIMRFQNLKIEDWVKLCSLLNEVLLRKALEVKENVD